MWYFLLYKSFTSISMSRPAVLSCLLLFPRPLRILPVSQLKIYVGIHDNLHRINAQGMLNVNLRDAWH